MTEPKQSRRRVLQLLAMAGAGVTSPCRSHDERFEWTGSALGADARILFMGLSRTAAEDAVQASLAEIERLERIFSLHRLDTELVRLNTDGRLRLPSLDLMQLLRMSRVLNARTDGLFDPTIQPLWRCYARWYGEKPDRGPPPSDAASALLARVGLHRVSIAQDAIQLAPGTELTLNGIAQGYITDRVADLLRRRGLSHVLIDIGEVRALDGRADSSPFKISVRDGGFTLPLADGALATSSPTALVFSPTLRLGHILHPRTGLTASPWHSVTVQHGSAAVADGLSTALVLCDRAGIRRALARISGAHVWATRHDGAVEQFGSLSAMASHT